MANNVIKNKFTLGIFGLVVLGAFYWFQFRPTSIRKECHEVAINSAVADYVKSNTFTLRGKDVSPEEGKYDVGRYNNYFRSCLDSKGLSQ